MLSLSGLASEAQLALTKNLRWSSSVLLKKKKRKKKKERKVKKKRISLNGFGQTTFVSLQSGVAFGKA